MPARTNRAAARARGIAPVIPYKANEKDKHAFFGGKRDVVAKTLADCFEFVRSTRPKTPEAASDLEAIEIANLHSASGRMSASSHAIFT